MGCHGGDGFPDIGLQGFAPKLAKGEIASLSGASDDPRYFQISVPVQPGNSGGALVDYVNRVAWQGEQCALSLSKSKTVNPPPMMQACWAKKGGQFVARFVAFATTTQATSA
jgi:hypothetical protein